VAETPVFIPKEFAAQLTDACEYIIDLITDPDFSQRTERSIPIWTGSRMRTVIAISGLRLCVAWMKAGNWQPQLIEMPGFASLMGSRYSIRRVAAAFRHTGKLQPVSEWFDRAGYLAELQRTILGDHPAEEVILLELKPHEQKTRIDFYCTQTILVSSRGPFGTDTGRKGIILYTCRHEEENKGTAYLQSRDLR